MYAPAVREPPERDEIATRVDEPDAVGPGSRRAPGIGHLAPATFRLGVDTQRTAGDDGLDLTGVDRHAGPGVED